MRVGACAWALLSLWIGSSIAVGLFEGWMIEAGILFSFAASAWLLVRALVLRLRHPGTGVWRPPVTTAAILFVAALPVFVDDHLGLTWRARFRASEPALEAFARNAKPGFSEQEPRWFGLTRVTQIDTNGTAVRFLIGDCEIDQCGIAYSPDGEPTRKGKEWYQHIKGPWWHWVKTW
jgi:hypothetical protein